MPRDPRLGSYLLPVFLLTGVAPSPHPRGDGGSGRIRYQIDYHQPGDRHISVTITLPSPQVTPVHFGMPRAIPMGYGSQPYDRFVSGLVARDPRGRPIGTVDLDGPRWLVESTAETPFQSLSYRVDLDRMDHETLSAGHASRVRPRFIGLLGYSVLGFVAGFEDEPVELAVRLPTGWLVTTTLAPTADSAGSATVLAPNYYALADAQIMGGPGLLLRRMASAVPLTIAVYAEDSVDVGAVAELSDLALRKTAEYFGTTPFPHFTASLEVLKPVSPDHGYRFSMEHLESSTFRFAAGQVDLSSTGRDRFYFNLLHHFAHSWIPKRCAPAGYYPFVWDYSAPLDGIWFSEGWSQYAAVDAMAGDRPDKDGFRRLWAGRRYDQAAADSAPPIAGLSTPELSRIAAHQYFEDFRIGLTMVSRGALMAEAVDRRVRERTGGAKTFQDVTRGLLRWCAASSAPVTVAAIEAVVWNETNVEVGDLIDRWLAPRGRRADDRSKPDH